MFDPLSGGLPFGFAIPHKIWRKREIENYLCLREVLQRYAAGMEPDDLVGRAFRAMRREAMDEAIRRVEDAFGFSVATRGPPMKKSQRSSCLAYLQYTLNYSNSTTE